MATKNPQVYQPVEVWQLKFRIIYLQGFILLSHDLQHF